MLVLCVIAISLSMDAFSLSLAYGITNVNIKKIFQISFIVGLFHFIMPLLGSKVGVYILKLFPFNPNIIVGLILLYLGIEMLIESTKKIEKDKINSFFNIILFSLAVSVDSFSLGIGLSAITDNKLLASLIFSITSYLFTYIGLKIGKKVNKIVGKVSQVIGSLILIILSIIYFIK